MKGCDVYYGELVLTVIVLGYPTQLQKVLMTPSASDTKLEKIDACGSFAVVVDLVSTCFVIVAITSRFLGVDAVAVTVTVPGYFLAQYDVAGGYVLSGASTA